MNNDGPQQRSGRSLQQHSGKHSVMDLYHDLDAILRASEAMAASHSMGDDQVTEMALHLANMRGLLADLLIVLEGTDQGAAVQELLKRFLDVEGKVKEIRNDRALRN